MHAVLSDLIELQQLDNALRDYQRRIDRLPQELATLQKQQDEKKAEIKMLEEKIRNGELQRRQLELEEKRYRESLSKLRSQQLLTRRNEEYLALENALAATERAISENEDQQLILLDQIEHYHKQLQLAQERFSKTKEKTQQQIQDLQAQAKELAMQVEKTRNTISQVLARIDSEILTIYQRLVSGGKINAVVPLSSEGVCSGCHMKVVHQTMLDVRSNDKITTCENCGRILYDPEFEAEINSLYARRSRSDL